MAKITQVVGAGGASRRGRESPRYRGRQMLRRNEIPAHLCWAPSECSPRGITRRTRPTRGAIHARSIHSTSSDRASRPTRTSVQLQSTNAQTPPKIGKYQRPESKTIQQLAEPDEICKTSPVQIRAAPPTFAHACQLTVSYGWQATRRLPTVARSAEVGPQPFLLFHLPADPRSSCPDRSRTLAAAGASRVPFSSVFSDSEALSAS